MQEPQASSDNPATPQRPNPTLKAAWHIGEHQSHSDPLLDCLLAVARIHGISTSREALSSGLPLAENLLTPSLLPRAAARAGLTAKVVRRKLEGLRTSLLPAILLLNDHQACVLLEWTDDGRARICYPESGESSELVDAEILGEMYRGLVFFLRPKFRFDARTPETHKLRGRHWFWSVVGQNWRLYRDTLLAAALVNLFAVALPFYSMNVYDRVVPNRAEETLWVLTLGIALVLIFDLALRIVRSHIIDTAAKRIDVTLSARIMERVLGLRLSHRPSSVGSFAANLRAFESVRDFIASATVTALVDLPFVLLFLVLLIWISPWMLLPPLVGLLLVLFASMIAQQKMEEIVDVSQRATAQRNATLVEALVGLETIKFMGAEGTIQRRWEHATVFIAKTGGQLKLLSSITLGFAQTITQLVTISVVVVGVYLLIDNKITMGGIIASSMLAGRAMGPLGQIAGLLMQYHHARTGLASVESHMNAPQERPEDNQFLHRAQFQGDIEFKNVEFSYPDTDQSALRNVTFRIQAGEKVGIIGKVGSGKSTIQRLILGLYQPTEGAVLVDGVDVRQIDPAELRRAIGFVPQDTNLFFGSLRENIAMGAPFADDEMILASAELAGVMEFANRHPRGFDMPVGERGESLSGGQRQAVAIARALLNDPPILLLDEPTSAMDHQSEDRLRARLRTFAKQKTVIIVTHRTSLLDLVDRLIVIDNGQIVADGPKAQVVDALQQGRVGRAN